VSAVHLDWERAWRPPGEREDLHLLVARLRAAGVVLARVGDRIRCNAPVGGIDSATREELARRRSELLDYLDDTDVAAADAKTKAPRKGPLSFAQERLLYLDRLGAGAAYNLGAASRIRGPLSVDALESALDAIVRRHPILAVRFAQEGDEPFQTLDGVPPARLERIDLRTEPLAARERACKRLVADELHRPFDLALGPLFRRLLVRIADEEHCLVLTMHHAVADGWSLHILIRELAALYAAARNGWGDLDTLLPRLPKHFIEHAGAQRSEDPSTRHGQLAYWVRKLEGVSERVDLAQDRARPAAPSDRGRVRNFSIDLDLAERIRTLAQSRAVTPFMVTFACFAACLRAHVGLDDLPIGVPLAGRTRPEIEPLVGCFVNTVVLRANLAGDPCAIDLIDRVRELVLEALANQEVPFEQVVDALRPDRTADRAPLFQVMFNLLSALDGPAFGDLRVDAFELEDRPVKVDLMLTIEDAGPGKPMRGVLEHRVDCVAPVTARRFAARYARLLRQMVADSGRPLSKLTVPTVAEGRAVDRWSRTDREPVRAGIDHLFWEQVRRTPDAIAVSWSGGQVSFGALGRRVRAIASRLRALGLAAEGRVVVLVTRSLDAVVAPLATIVAGGAYVAIDPRYPAERRRLVLREAAPAMILVSSALRLEAVSDAPEGVPVVCVDDGDDLQHALSGPNWGGRCPVAVLPARPGQLAYVLFTSGSTGVPKGVALTHGGVVAFLRWAERTFGAAERQAVLLTTSLCFDLSVFEIFLPLCAGGRVVVAEDALHLADLREAHHATLLNTVPSAVGELERRGELPASLLAINLAGEPLAPALVDRILERVPDAIVRDLYGPSECTTYSTCAVRRRGGPATIGRPIAGTDTFVLDPDGARSPVGVAGELYIAGAGLARGYWRRPDLTADRFLPNPFAGRGERMYRTGDIARWAPRGELDFLGRRDHQVKVRGHRIELSEIEVALRAQPRVEDACAIVLGTDGEASLYACVAACEAAALEPAVLMAFLRARLPGYMCPSRIDIVPALPLNANGKVDRAAVRRFGGSVRAGAAVRVSPRTSAEHSVASLWAEVLGVECVGATDDFFSLGGHSLLAIRMLSRLREREGVDISLRDFLDGPSVEALAKRLEERRGGSGGWPPISASGPAPIHPLSLQQESMLFLCRLEGGSRYLIPTAVAMNGELDVMVLTDAFRALVARHQSLRSAVVDGALVPSVEVTVPIAIDDIREIAEPDRRRWLEERAREEASTPFDLALAPLVRARLVRLTDRSAVLLLTLHHLVCDGWSVDLIFNELVAAYRELARRNTVALPPLPIQYSDFARWQRSADGEAAFQELEAFWKGRLEGAPVSLELPGRDGSPKPQATPVRSASYQVDADGAKFVRELARAEATSPFTVLFAAFVVLLQRYTGSDDVIAASMVACRERPELQGVVGLVANLVPVRARVTATSTFSELVRHVRTRLNEAVAHADLPFDRIVRGLPIPRSGKRVPLVDALFLVDHARRPAEVLPDLSFEPMDSRPFEARFALTCRIQSSAGDIVGAFDYDPGRLDDRVVARMAGDYVGLIGSLSRSGAETSLARLDGFVTRRSRAETPLVEPALSPELPVHRAIARRARARPDAVALTFRGAHVTYGALGRAVSACAAALRELGVGPESKVALCADPSPEAIVAILGIMEAGGAYVPLDPAYPLDRLGYMAERSGVHTAIASADCRRFVPPGVAHVLALERVVSLPSLPQRRFADPAPGNVAYVIFTSGTTGRPKGIEVTHAGLANLAFAQARAFDVDERSRVLQFASLGFDASVSEIFVTLLAGGCLVLEQGKARLPGEGLIERIEREQVTVVTLPPSALAVTPVRPLLALETLVVAGEACAPAVAGAWVGSRRFLNAYGPSEVSVCASVGPIVDPARPQRIGRPIARTAMAVVDSLWRPTPAGVEGHLVISGVGLARGYVGDPAATAERFRPDIEGPPGSRTYWTGDRARLLEDGDFEFRGRSDDQVKLRGYRIEPREIEEVLRTNPLVREAVVVVRSTPSGDGRIVAYVRPAESQAPVQSLWDLLRAKLPAFMVPSAIVSVDRWPTSPNGKIDRGALPLPEASAEPTATVPPRDDLEFGLAQLWAEVLGAPAVGVHDDFFALGGHSLRAVVLVDAIRREFGHFPLSTFLEAPTVASAARALRTGGHRRAGPLVRLRRGSAPGAWVLVHGADGTLLPFRELVHRLDTGASIYGMQAAGIDSGQPPLASVSAFADEYLRALESEPSGAPLRLVGFSAGGWIAFEMACRLEAAGSPPALLALLDCAAPDRRPRDLSPAHLFVAFSHAVGGDRLAEGIEVEGSPSVDAFVSRMAGIDRAHWFEELARAAVRTGLLPAGGAADALERSFAVYSAMHRAGMEYRPGRYGRSALVVRASREPTREGGDPLLGWEAHIAEVQSLELECAHRTLLSQPYVCSLAQWLSRHGSEEAEGGP
jgi:amino acid adenylation domain-containing protein